MKRYTIRLVSGICALLLFTLVFNWFMNPYDIFDGPVIDGVNSYKPEVERFTRLSKVYKVESVKPDVVLLASSRGLVITEDIFAGHGEKAFNMSLPSGSTYELMRMLQHVLSQKKIKRVVLALDERFSGSVKQNFVEQRLDVNADGSNNTHRMKQKMRDTFNAVLSFDALRSSIRTLSKQMYSPEGMPDEVYRKKRVAIAGGNRQMFRNLESSMLSGKVILDPDRCDNETFNEDGDAFKYFSKIVELAYTNDIELLIYFSPVHARYYEVQCLIGRWRAIEKMKREVVHAIENMAVKFNSEAFKVWDFSGYSRITTERLPALGNIDEVMKWYWEDSHYTRETAALVFNRMYEVSDEDFGVLINSDNITEHLMLLREKRKKYIRINSADIIEILSLSDKDKR